MSMKKKLRGAPGRHNYKAMWAFLGFLGLSLMADNVGAQEINDFIRQEERLPTMNMGYDMETGTGVETRIPFYTNMPSRSFSRVEVDFDGDCIPDTVMSEPGPLRRRFSKPGKYPVRAKAFMKNGEKMVAGVDIDVRNDLTKQAFTFPVPVKRPPSLEKSSIALPDTIDNFYAIVFGGYDTEYFMIEAAQMKTFFNNIGADPSNIVYLMHDGTNNDYGFVNRGAATKKNLIAARDSIYSLMREREKMGEKNVLIVFLDSHGKGYTVGENECNYQTSVPPIGTYEGDPRNEYLDLDIKGGKVKLAILTDDVSNQKREMMGRGGMGYHEIGMNERRLIIRSEEEDNQDYQYIYVMEYVPTMDNMRMKKLYRAFSWDTNRNLRVDSGEEVIYDGHDIDMSYLIEEPVDEMRGIWYDINRNGVWDIPFAWPVDDTLRLCIYMDGGTNPYPLIRSAVDMDNDGVVELETGYDYISFQGAVRGYNEDVTDLELTEILDSDTSECPGWLVPFNRQCKGDENSDNLYGNRIINVAMCGKYEVANSRNLLMRGLLEGTSPVNSGTGDTYAADLDDGKADGFVSLLDLINHVRKGYRSSYEEGWISRMRLNGNNDNKSERAVNDRWSAEGEGENPSNIIIPYRGSFTSVRTGGGNKGKNVYPAHPNPFNDRTTLRLDKKGDGFRIYDIMGRLVREMHPGQMPPGIYEVPWDGTDKNGTDLPSGMYLYKPDNSSKTYKIIKMR